MQAINSSERRKASLNFMLLFLVCVAIIVTTVFTSTRVPFSHNKVLREEQKITEKSNAVRKEFTEKLISISHLIDSLDKIKIEDFNNLDIRIDDEIEELRKITANAEADDKILYDNISTNLNDYYEAKKTGLQKNDTNADIKALNQEKNDLIRERDDWKKNYFDLIKQSKN